MSFVIFYAKNVKIIEKICVFLLMGNFKQSFMFPLGFLIFKCFSVFIGLTNSHSKKEILRKNLIDPL